MTDEVIETVTVQGDDMSVSLIVWRRFRRPMPGLVERIYAMNSELGENGPYLPPGTTLLMPVPIPRGDAALPAIRLW